jgi:hypothetical protein
MDILKGAESPENQGGNDMANLTAGTKVTAHNGTSSVGHQFIRETFRTGEVVKVNAKSIRVSLTHERHTTNGKVQGEHEINQTATFTFWKYRNDNGKALYKNALLGIITLEA